MQFFKYTLIVALFTINSVQAKRTSTATQPVTTGITPTQPVITQPQPQIQPQPKPQPQVQAQPIQPKVTVKTFKQIVADIKNTPINTVWDSSNKVLKQTFVNALIQDAKNAQLTRDQLQILLSIARDLHAQFTGNNAQDLVILNNINTQIENAL